MILPDLRRALLSGACVLLLAGCGGDGEAGSPGADTVQAAAPADSAGPSFGTPAAPAVVAASGDSAAAVPGAATPAPVAAADRPVRDSTKMKEILQAPVAGPVNVETLETYNLSMDRVRQLVRAGQNLAELQRRRPDLADSVRMQAFDPNAIYEKVNSIPDVRNAVAQAGMSPREYATATAALMQAVMVRQMRAQGMRPQVQVNEANVEFVDEHWSEIMQIAQSMAQQARPRN
ncbi:hypothetical protein [Longimicrobium sp.]|uniref:hypothetical protein n=1 Tax=Longimicrobium sp. TaxID=2029185 RepID=UPI002E305E19|nr:hypothetical protein [Longimicrobium sp.]HEX6039602.1 hypothetical protein [Longimicrobium sp.]